MLKPVPQEKSEFARIREAYLRMAKEVGHRPAGQMLTPEEMADPAVLDVEASEYATAFIADEDNIGAFHIGVSNWTTNRALVYTIEAARLLCCACNQAAAKLLKMAIDDVKGK